MKPYQLFQRLGGGSGGGGGTDPYWANVVALVQGTGADGSTTIVDDTGLRTWTQHGNLQVDDSLGPNTLLSDGTGDYATTPYVKADFDWWTGDFTIEAWVQASAFTDWYYTDGSPVPAFVGCADPASGTNYWSFGPKNGGFVGFSYYNGSANHLTSTLVVSTSALTHLAMSKSSGGIYLAKGGVVDSPVSVSGTPLSSTSGVSLTLGQINNRCCPGNFVLRITKGVARYTSAYTPPTLPFPTS